MRVKARCMECRLWRVLDWRLRPRLSNEEFRAHVLLELVAILSFYTDQCNYGSELRGDQYMSMRVELLSLSKGMYGQVPLNTKAEQGMLFAALSC
jgi:hypothetical protein